VGAKIVPICCRRNRPCRRAFVGRTGRVTNGEFRLSLYSCSVLELGKGPRNIFVPTIALLHARKIEPGMDAGAYGLRNRRRDRASVLTRWARIGERTVGQGSNEGAYGRFTRNESGWRLCLGARIAWGWEVLREAKARATNRSPCLWRAARGGFISASPVVIQGVLVLFTRAVRADRYGPPPLSRLSLGHPFPRSGLPSGSNSSRRFSCVPLNAFSSYFTFSIPSSLLFFERLFLYICSYTLLHLCFPSLAGGRVARFIFSPLLFAGPPPYPPFCISPIDLPMARSDPPSLCLFCSFHCVAPFSLQIYKLILCLFILC